MAKLTHLSRLAAVLLVTAALLAATGCGTSPDTAPQTTAAPTTTAAPGTGDPIQLRYSYPAGGSWAHEATTVAESAIDAALMGAGEGTVTSSETTTERRVTSVVEAPADGTATLELTKETVSSLVDGVAEDVSGQAPKVTTIALDATGRVLAVEGADDPAATSGTFDSSGFSRLFDYLDAGYDLTAILYPEDGTAAVGEEWTSGYAIPLPGMGKELTLSTTAKLTAVSTEAGRQIATIEHTSRLPLEVTFDLSAYFRAVLEGSAYAGDLATLVVKMTAEGELTYSGTSRVDIATGRIVSADGLSTMKMNLTYTEAPVELMPLDQRGPFAMDASGTVTITEVK